MIEESKMPTTSDRKGTDGLAQATEETMEVLFEIFNECENVSDKVEISVTEVHGDVTIIYHDMDEAWTQDLIQSVKNNES